MTSKVQLNQSQFSNVELNAAKLIVKNLKLLVKRRRKERKLEEKMRMIAEQDRAYEAGEIFEKESIDLNDSSSFDINDLVDEPVDQSPLPNTQRNQP